MTLVELLVVLILMGLAAALVVPALLGPGRDHDDLQALLAQAREVAARREEIIFVRISPTGRWRMEGGDARGGGGTLATGQVHPTVGAPITLVVSPVGTCTFDAATSAAARVLALEPLICEVHRP
ncbi:MAG TPA: hypothetical protein VHQ03_05945 [Candidatus Dormibacteraeota bacterium]|nr:hypothetical protein [Candidatus Dormibacteraeota bacterium]